MTCPPILVWSMASLINYLLPFVVFLRSKFGGNFNELSHFGHFDNIFQQPRHLIQCKEALGAGVDIHYQHHDHAVTFQRLTATAPRQDCQNPVLDFSLVTATILPKKFVGLKVTLLLRKKPLWGSIVHPPSPRCGVACPHEEGASDQP